MIFHHINHKMPIYKDCTFFEVAVVGVGAFVAMFITLSLLTWLLFGHALIGIALSVFSITFVTRLLLAQLQKLKYGKPYGYYRHVFLRKMGGMATIGTLFHSPFVVLKTRWSVRRARHDH